MDTLEAVRLRAAGKTFREIGAELGMSAPGSHKALKRGLEDKANEISEAAGEFRALESERLDAAAQALWAKVAADEERAQEVWLKNRTRFATWRGRTVLLQEHSERRHYNPSMGAGVTRRTRGAIPCGALVSVSGAAGQTDALVVADVVNPGPDGEITRTYDLTSPLTLGPAGCEAPTLRIACFRTETLLVVTIDMGPAVRR